MLSFLSPAASMARASPQLARRMQASVTSVRSKSSFRCSSTFGPRQSRASAVAEEDVDEADTGSHRSEDDTAQSPFSHFFDRRKPAPIQASSRRRVPRERLSASQRATNALRQATDTCSPSKIIRAYDDLVQEHQRQFEDLTGSTSKHIEPKDDVFPLRKTNVQAAIRHLVHHAQHEGHMEPWVAEACRRMFHDLSNRFGFSIDTIDLHRQLQTYLLQKDDGEDPAAAFRSLRESYPDWQSTPVHWNMVISALAKRSDYQQAIQVWQEMLVVGIQPVTFLRDTMTDVFVAVHNTPEQAQLENLARGGGEIGFHTSTVVVEALCGLVGKNVSDDALIANLSGHASRLRKAVEDRPQDEASIAAQHTLLRYEAVVGGPGQALKAAKMALSSGRSESQTLELLLEAHSRALRSVQNSDEAVELLERILAAIDPERKIEPDDKGYHLLMLGLLHTTASESASVDVADAHERGDWSQPASPSPNQIHEAQLLYDHARSLRVSPTPQLVTPLLRAYCEAFIPSIPAAMKLVHDMLDHRAATERLAPKAESFARPRSDEIGTDIMWPVVEACVRLRDLASCRALLSRLRESNLALSADDKVELMLLLFGIATSWAEVFDIYHDVSRFRNSGQGLDEDAYLNLLRSLIGLSFPHPQMKGGKIAAPPEALLRFLQDMRHDGVLPSCKVYTKILHYYTKTPPVSYFGVRAMHELLKRDEALEPDLPLINALMNAYNHAREPAMVLAIWDSLLATRQEIDGVTLSVLFDTAGRHGLLALARKALATAQRTEQEARESGRRRTLMTKGAWDSWLECLAKCGRLDEAIEVAFGQMRTTLFRDAIEAQTLEGAVGQSVMEVMARAQKAPVRDRNGNVLGPDAKTFNTLLKFAAQERDRRQKVAVGGIFSMWYEHRGQQRVQRRSTSIWHTLCARIREEFSWLVPKLEGMTESSPP